MTGWFRSWHGAPCDPKWLVVARKAGVPPGIVSAIVWALFDHASQAEPRGDVSGFDIETYAAFSGFDESVIEIVFAALKGKGVVTDEGVLAAWARRQPKREDETAVYRKRRQRERSRGNGHDPEPGSREVTNGHAMSRNVTNGHDRTEQNRAEQNREEKRESRVCVSVEGESEREGRAGARHTHTHAPGPRLVSEKGKIPEVHLQKSPVPAGNRIPVDFALSPELRSFAHQEGLSDDETRRAFDDFTDWFRSNGKRSCDWPAECRRWFRIAVQRRTERLGPVSADRGGYSIASAWNEIGSDVVEYLKRTAHPVGSPRSRSG